MNPQTMKDDLTEYASLKRQIAILEDRLEELKPKVEEAVLTLNPTDMTVEAEGLGTFTLVAKRKYEYPESIMLAEASLKQSKKEAEATGEAPYTESRFLKFTSINIE